jgi:hypothetical protein
MNESGGTRVSEDGKWERVPFPRVPFAVVVGSGAAAFVIWALALVLGASGDHRDLWLAFGGGLVGGAVLMGLLTAVFANRLRQGEAQPSASRPGVSWFVLMGGIAAGVGGSIADAGLPFRVGVLAAVGGALLAAVFAPDYVLTNSPPDDD